MLLQGANSSVEWKPHDTFLACSKAFRNLSRKTICPLKIESCFKIIFAAKRMDKYCWSRKHKVINYDTGSQEHRCLWIRSNWGINSSTFGFVGSIQQVLPKQLNSPCFPQPARGTGCYPWAGWVLGRTWDSYWNDVAVGKGAVTERNGSVGTLPHSDQRKAARGFQISYDWFSIKYFIIHGIHNIYIA